MGLSIPEVARISGHKDVKQSRLTHNLKVAGSNPAPATKIKSLIQYVSGFLLFKDNFETKKLPRSLPRSYVAWCYRAIASGRPLNRKSTRWANSASSDVVA
jgi:hypothetical protein